MATSENLAAAFAGESQANRKYLAFAKKAEADGMPGAARLFRAAAEAETVHAHAHLRVMGGIKGTKENLEAAVEGESFEYQKMYPQFVEQAKAEGNKAALTSFQYAMAVERIHAKMYIDALKAVEAGKDVPAQAVYVCSVCGNTFVGEVPDTCPICGVKKEKFFEVK